MLLRKKQEKTIEPTKLQEMKKFYEENSEFPVWTIGRLQKDFQELQNQQLSDQNCQFQIKKQVKNQNFYEIYVEINPLVGQFSNKLHQLTLQIPNQYPYMPIKVYANHRIYHPNVHQQSLQLYLKILDDEFWKPIYTIFIVLLQIKLIFLEPDLSYIPNTSANIDCAHEYKYNEKIFEQKQAQIYQDIDSEILENELQSKMQIEDSSISSLKIIQNNNQIIQISKLSLQNNDQHNTTITSDDNSEQIIDEQVNQQQILQHQTDIDKSLQNQKTINCVSSTKKRTKRDFKETKISNIKLSKYQ